MNDFGLHLYLIYPPAVSIYPLCDEERYASKLIEVSRGGYEDSIALGAYDLLNYYLHRPIWELSGDFYTTKLSSIPNKKGNEEEETRLINEYKQSVLDGTYQSWYVEKGEREYKILVKAYTQLKENYNDVLNNYGIKLFDLPEKDLSMPLVGMDSHYLVKKENNCQAQKEKSDRLIAKLIKKLNDEEKTTNPTINKNKP